MRNEMKVRNTTVAAMVDVSVARADGLQLFGARWQEFSRWWLSEFRQLIPSGWLDGDAMRRLLIWRDRDLVFCRLVSDEVELETQFALDGFGKGALIEWLAEKGLSREQVMVGAAIGRDLFFLRDLHVPKAALGALPKILDQELVRRTPFELSDIWQGATPGIGGSADIVALCQWIIRKDRAEAALTELGLAASDIDFLAARDGNHEVVPVVWFGASNVGDDPPWARRTVKCLAAAALGTVIFGLVAFEWCQSNLANSMQASLLELRGGAQGDFRSLDQSARLFALKANIAVLDIWDELSRVLPKHTFLTETRIADHAVTLSGFSADAARLVRIIDQSPLFSGAILTAPIRPDNTERKDRFSISFKVSDVQPPRSSASYRSPASP
jgi:general secretion pathway protein L